MMLQPEEFRFSTEERCFCIPPHGSEFNQTYQIENSIPYRPIKINGHLRRVSRHTYLWYEPINIFCGCYASLLTFTTAGQKWTRKGHFKISQYRDGISTSAERINLHALHILGELPVQKDGRGRAATTMPGTSTSTGRYSLKDMSNEGHIVTLNIAIPSQTARALIVSMDAHDHHGLGFPRVKVFPD